MKLAPMSDRSKCKPRPRLYTLRELAESVNKSLAELRGMFKGAPKAKVVRHNGSYYDLKEFKEWYRNR